MSTAPFTIADEELVDVLVRRFVPDATPRLLDIMLVLARAVREDHVALDLTTPKTTFFAYGKLLEMDEADVAQTVLAELRKWPHLCEFVDVSSGLPAAGAPLVVVEGRFLYLRRLANAERRVALALDEGRHVESYRGLTPESSEVRSAVAFVTADLASRGQASAELEQVVANILTRRVSLITGGPGTGKTWIVTQALRVLDHALLGIDVDGVRPTFVVAAPTGKAATRVAESIGTAMNGVEFNHLVRDRIREGSLHHLLGVRPGGNQRPSHLPHDFVVIDEVSMADLSILDLLFAATYSAGERSTRIVLIGDPHQLASVNVGAVLADAVAPEAEMDVAITRLVTVHRTDSRDILQMAEAINTGDADRAIGLLAEGSSVQRVARATEESLVQLVIDHAAMVLAKAQAGDGAAALEALHELQVLAANRQGEGSVAWWNATVSDALRPHAPARSGERFGVGEPVLVTRNQRSLNLSNGDVGIVIERGSERVVYFDEHRAHPISAVGFSELAWAMTIHKSQGSEYRHVVVVLPRLDSPLLTRELFYTGVTRAQKLVTIVGSNEALAGAIKAPIARVSGLATRLARLVS